MEPIIFQGEKVKATIPTKLYKAVVRLQGANDLEWSQACNLAAERIEENSREFAKSVEREVLSRYRSRYMVEINKARKTIEDEAFKRTKRGYPTEQSGVTPLARLLHHVYRATPFISFGQTGLLRPAPRTSAWPQVGESELAWVPADEDPHFQEVDTHRRCSNSAAGHT